MTAPLFIGGLGPVELGIIALMLVLLFGHKKIPALARSLAEAGGEFRKARTADPDAGGGETDA